MMYHDVVSLAASIKKVRADRQYVLIRVSVSPCVRRTCSIAGAKYSSKIKNVWFAYVDLITASRASAEPSPGLYSDERNTTNACRPYFGVLPGLGDERDIQGLLC